MESIRNKPTTADTLKNFDSLPDSAIVRAPVVAGLYNCCEASIWRWAKDKRIPAPRQISPGFTAWNVGELRKSLAGDPA